VAEPIKMPFELWTWVGLGNHVLDGDPDLPTQWLKYKFGAQEL